MKKYFVVVLVATVLSIGGVCAQDSSSDIEESYKNMVGMIPVKNDGIFAIQYDPFGQHEIALVGNLCIAGPWCADLSLGFLDFTGDFAVSIGIDPLNFHWKFALTEKIAWGFGAGVPLYIHARDFDIGVNPHGQIDISFFTNSPVSMIIYARPGARISFMGDKVRFTCPFGIGVSLPCGSIIDILESFGRVFSSAI